MLGVAAKEQHYWEADSYWEGGGSHLPPILAARAVFCSQRILRYFTGYS